jgi:hypothetical protein
VVHFGAHEAVELIEAFPNRPPVERAAGSDFARRCLVPLAERRRTVPVVAKSLGYRCCAGRAETRVTGSRGAHFGGHAHAHRVVVPPGHQGLAGGGAQCCDVEAAVAQPFLGQLVGCRHLAWTTEST